MLDMPIFRTSYFSSSCTVFPTGIRIGWSGIREYRNIWVYRTMGIQGEVKQGQYPFNTSWYLDKEKAEMSLWHHSFNILTYHLNIFLGVSGSSVKQWYHIYWDLLSSIGSGHDFYLQMLALLASLGKTFSKEKRNSNINM